MRYLLKRSGVTALFYFGALALWFFSAQALAQPIPNNCSAVNASCRARQFVLLPGNKLCLNGIPCTTNIAAGTAGDMDLTSGVINSGSNIGFILNTTHSLGGSTKILSLRNGGSEVVYVDNASGLVSAVQIAAQANLLMGGVINLSGSGLVAPATALMASNVADGASAVGIALNTINTMATAGAKLLSVRNNGVEKAGISKDGSLQGVATDSSGTPGAATANTPTGQATIAGSAGTVTITNSLVGTTSIILGALQATDAVCTSIKSIVPSSGSFVVTTNGICSGNTKVGWVVLNGL